MTEAVQRSADQKQPDFIEEDPQERPHGQGGEEAVDHRRHPGQNLQQRLDHRPRAAPGVFRQIDGRQKSDRRGHAHGDRHDQQGAREQGHGAECPGRSHLVGADGDLGAPLGSEQEVEDRDPLEKAEGVEGQGGDDADRRQNGDGGTDEQGAVHPAFHPVARACLGTDLGHGEQTAQDGGQDGGQSPAPLQGALDTDHAARFDRELLGQGPFPDLKGGLAATEAMGVGEESVATERIQGGHLRRRVHCGQLPLQGRREQTHQHQNQQGRRGDPDQGVGAMLSGSRMRLGPDGAADGQGATAQIGGDAERDEDQ